MSSKSRIDEVDGGKNKDQISTVTLEITSMLYKIKFSFSQSSGILNSKIIIYINQSQSTMTPSLHHHNTDII